MATVLTVSIIFIGFEKDSSFNDNSGMTGHAGAVADTLVVLL